MNWIPKALIAIAASNTFGAINYYLKNTGIIIDNYKLIKFIVLFSAYSVAVLAYRRNSIAVMFSYIFLVLGVVGSCLAIYTGIQIGGNKTLLLAYFWLLSFSVTIYIFYKHQSKNGKDIA